MGYTAPYPAYYGAPSAYPPNYQLAKPAAQYPPAQGYPAGQPGFGGQQAQGFSGQQPQGYAGGGGQQQFSNPNYQYYIGTNPPK